MPKSASKLLKEPGTYDVGARNCATSCILKGTELPLLGPPNLPRSLSPEYKRCCAGADGTSNRCRAHKEQRCWQLKIELKTNTAKAPVSKSIVIAWAVPEYSLQKPGKRLIASPREKRILLSRKRTPFATTDCWRYERSVKMLGDVPEPPAGSENKTKLRRRSFVLHICRRNHQSTHIEAVLTPCGCGLLPAATLSEAVLQLPLADVVIISSCWTQDEKHKLVATLQLRSTVPVICLYDAAAHSCGCCTEVSDTDPEALVAAVAQAVKSRAAASGR